MSTMPGVGLVAKPADSEVKALNNNAGGGGGGAGYGQAQTPEQAPESTTWEKLAQELKRAQEALQQPILDQFVCSQDPNRTRTLLDLVGKETAV